MPLQEVSQQTLQLQPGTDALYKNKQESDWAFTLLTILYFYQKNTFQRLPPHDKSNSKDQA